MSWQPPDPGWIPFLKLGFGFLLLLVLGFLATITGLGKVEAASSYGLDIILGGLLTLAGAFAGWAFKEKRSDEKE
jgi:thiol:disulfide interchange protein